MEDRFGEDEYEELGDEQKVAIGRWFLMNAPPGQVLQVAKDVREVLMDEAPYSKAASEAFPDYNVKNMISLEMPDGSGEVRISQSSFCVVAHGSKHLWR